MISHGHNKDIASAITIFESLLAGVTPADLHTSNYAYAQTTAFDTYDAIIESCIAAGAFSELNRYWNEMIAYSDAQNLHYRPSTPLRVDTTVQKHYRLDESRILYKNVDQALSGNHPKRVRVRPGVLPITINRLLLHFYDTSQYAMIIDVWTEFYPTFFFDSDSFEIVCWAFIHTDEYDIAQRVNYIMVQNFFSPSVTLNNLMMAHRKEHRNEKLEQAYAEFEKDQRLRDN